MLGNAYAVQGKSLVFVSTVLYNVLYSLFINSNFLASWWATLSVADLVMMQNKVVNCLQKLFFSVL